MRTDTTERSKTIDPAANAPDVQFACITDQDRQHAFFWAATTEGFDTLLDVYERVEKLSVKPFEFDDPRIVNEMWVRLAEAQRASGRPMTIMVGSVRDGRWFNWNLETAPCPPVPSC
ncbi:hypothetical protein ABZY68_25485 [Streptomyces sp. NPDC006482]|uniref:hypothetical protein n=1 Tax=Streptomyces sp. NPDC006482 TaxID=3154306 RepID=UPI0033BA4B02